jgi:diaminohydroxyphosphoribosylaminopyrimidine deaminase / 5-amino-6-(5-phosphoribosylamino)uracil reductase
MNNKFSAFDERAMTRALELAERGLETTHPNPRVGCVIARGEQIIAEGWHEWPGEPHAEVIALRAAGAKAKGATAYVTLEPCSHVGRTPPCANALVESGLKRVVFAMQDPNPLVNGRGAELLRNAGIQVESGLMEREAEELNVGFLKRVREGRPWVRVKLGMSLDGRTALASGESKWITGEEARADVQLWRARSSAILTGSGTILADDPRLDVRLPAERRRYPTRVVLDRWLRTPPAAKIFATPGDVVIFAADSEYLAERYAAFAGQSVLIETLPQQADGLFNMHDVLVRLAELDVVELFVEAGPILAGALLRESLVDELLIYMAPVVLGPQSRPLFELLEVPSLADAPRFTIIESRLIGTDTRLRLRPA